MIKEKLKKRHEVLLKANLKGNIVEFENSREPNATLPILHEPKMYFFFLSLIMS